MSPEEIKTQNYKFYQHRACEYFPCHDGVASEDFSCMFCYCPLYFLGGKCGGAYRVTEDGIKDCTDCTFPHRRCNYDKMMERIGENIKNMDLSGAAEKK